MTTPRSSLWIGLDQQVPALVVVEWKFGQADSMLPVSLASLVLQPTHRSLDILGASGERLTHHGYVSRLAAVERAQVGHPSCDLGRRGWIRHESDPHRPHTGLVSTDGCGYTPR